MMSTRRDFIRKAGLSAALISIPATAGVIANKSEASALVLQNTDPVFAAIEAHRAALDACDVDDEFDFPAIFIAHKEEERVRLEFFATAPTTPAGLEAYVDHIEGRFGRSIVIADDYARLLLNAVRQFAKGRA